MTYFKNKKLYKVNIITLAMLLISIMIISLTLGSVKIPLVDVFKIILNKFGLNMDIESVKKSNIFIVLNIRLPRIILSSLVGGVLAIVGTSFQGIFKNPMAEPYVMGSSSGAAFGATIGIILGLNNGLLGFGLISILAFLGSIITTTLVYNLARNGNKVDTTSILLSGIVISSFLSSIISFLMIFNRDELVNIVSWTFGSFNGANWSQIKIISIPILLGMLLLCLLNRELNGLAMGNENAINMGINVELIKKVVLVISSLLAGFAVSVSGIIGFVGLIIPHLFRLIFGSDHRILLPVSAIGGGIFLLICDTLSRTIISGTEIPVGIITSVFGGPFFLYLLRKSRKSI